MDTAKLGKRGTLVIPAKLRQRFALKEGDLLVTEEREDGILLRPAVAVPVEIYTPRRKAEFALNNSPHQRGLRRSLSRLSATNSASIPQRSPTPTRRCAHRLPTNAEFDSWIERNRRKTTGSRRERRETCLNCCASSSMPTSSSPRRYENDHRFLQFWRMRDLVPMTSMYAADETQQKLCQ